MTTPYAQEPQPKPYPPAQQSAGEDHFAEPEGYVGEQEFPAYPPTQHTGGEVAPYQQAPPMPVGQERQGQNWDQWRSFAVPLAVMLAFVLFMVTRQWWWWMLIPLVGVIFKQLPRGSRDRHRGGSS